MISLFRNIKRDAWCSGHPPPRETGGGGDGKASFIHSKTNERGLYIHRYKQEGSPTIRCDRVVSALSPALAPPPKMRPIEVVPFVSQLAAADNDVVGFIGVADYGGRGSAVVARGGQDRCPSGLLVHCGRVSIRIGFWIVQNLEFWGNGRCGGQTNQRFPLWSQLKRSCRTTAQPPSGHLRLFWRE